MKVNQLVFIFAGMTILASVYLTQKHDANWMWLTVFVGANLLQSGFTKFCPLAFFLKKAGVSE